MYLRVYGHVCRSYMMACILMACMVVANVVMAHEVMANTVMANIVMAYRYVCVDMRIDICG